jgi:hypothetical protein
MKPEATSGSAIDCGPMTWVSKLTVRPRPRSRPIPLPDELAPHIAITLSANVSSKCGTFKRSAMQDVTLNSIFLTDGAHYAVINAIYATYFPGDKPARFFILCGLAKPNVLVEIASTHIGQNW